MDILKEVFIQPDKFRELEAKNKELTEKIEALSQEIKEKDELSHNLWKEVLVEEIRKLVKKEAIKP